MNNNYPGLFFDHIYFVISEERFDCIRKENTFKYTKTTTKEGLSWEGLYLFSSDKVYFELIRESELDKLWSCGICFSGHGKKDFIQTVENRNGCKGWKKEMQREENGDEWFESLSSSEKSERLYFWISDYKGVRAAGRDAFNVEPNSDSIESFEVVAPKEAIRDFLISIEWYMKPITVDSSFKLCFDKPGNRKFELVLKEIEHEREEISKLTFKKDGELNEVNF